MIKVLHSELQANIGGIESFLLNLTKSIDMTNIHFDMLMRGNNQFLEDELKKLGVTIYKVPTNPIQYYRFVKDLLKTNNYNFVHVHKNSAANIVLPLMVKKYTNSKLIVHSHNTNPSGGSKSAVILHKLNRNKLIELSDYRLACSDTAAEWMYGKDYKDKQVKIIKNGIIAKNYLYDPKVRKMMRKQLELEGKFVIGHVGAFREQKNHKFLIDIFSKINIPNAELVLVGDGPLKGKIEDQVKSLKIENKVKFLGSRNDVNNILQAFDIFVMPSLWEGLGIAAIEAQASGLPTLVSPNFPKETKISDLIAYLSLNQPEKWIDYIQNWFDTCHVRKSSLQEINNSGYDMQLSSQIIREIYLN